MSQAVRDVIADSVHELNLKSKVDEMSVFKQFNLPLFEPGAYLEQTLVIFLM